MDDGFGQDGCRGFTSSHSQCQLKLAGEVARRTVTCKTITQSFRTSMTSSGLESIAGNIIYVYSISLSTLVPTDCSLLDVPNDDHLVLQADKLRQLQQID